MYKLSRLMLIGTVLATLCCVAVLVAQFGVVIPVGIGIALVVAYAKRGYGAFTAFGTARWADAEDLRATGMLGATAGLIIGRVTDAAKRPLSKAARELFDPKVPSKEACEEFLKAMQLRRKPTTNPALVRLPNAVHTAVFAPTGVGKGVSCVVPFLLSSADSAVVVDFKGENARLTAEHRRRVFGHRIVMLDPFKVVAKQSDTFNPLDFIDKDSPVAIDECSKDDPFTGRQIEQTEEFIEIKLDTGHDEDRARICKDKLLFAAKDAPRGWLEMARGRWIPA